jgi:hypothetical protein
MSRLPAFPCPDAPGSPDAPSLRSSCPESASGLAPPRASPRPGTKLSLRLSQRGLCPGAGESWCGLVSRRGRESRRGSCPCAGCCPDARRSQAIVPVVLSFDRAAVITLQDLTDRDLRAHESVSSGSRPRGGEAAALLAVLVKMVEIQSVGMLLNNLLEELLFATRRKGLIRICSPYDCDKIIIRSCCV